MAWKKAPDWLVDAFGELLPDDPRVDRRKMFGYPCAFANDNMFIGLHEHRLVLRLPEEAREDFRAATGATPFQPFEGREMREYSVVPEELITDRRDDLRPWILRSLEYASSLPPKKKKKRKG